MQAAKRERLRYVLVLFVVTAGPTGLAPSSSAQSSSRESKKPATLSAEQDHQRLMDLLHITSLRQGPSGDPKAADAANLDESKVPPYTLPDPLVLKNGKRVVDAETWWKIRRPEIVEDFDRGIYGREPKQTPKVTWEVTNTTREENDGVAVVTKTLLGHVDNLAYPQVKVDIELTLTTPARVSGPVPVMMELGWGAKTLEALRAHFTAQQWADFVGKGPSWQQQVLAKGLGLCDADSYQRSSGQRRRLEGRDHRLGQPRADAEAG